MKKAMGLVLLGVSCLLLCSCMMVRQDLKIGVLQTEKLASQWPKFRETWMKYRTESFQIAKSLKKQKNLGERERRIVAETSEKWQKVNEELRLEAKDAAIAVAKDRRLNLVIVNEGVEYGGTDITEEVLKLLK